VTFTFLFIIIIIIRLQTVSVHSRPLCGFRSNLIHSSWLLVIPELSVLTDSTVLHYYRWRNYCVESRPVLLELFRNFQNFTHRYQFCEYFENYFQIVFVIIQYSNFRMKAQKFQKHFSYLMLFLFVFISDYIISSNQYVIQTDWYIVANGTRLKIICPYFFECQDRKAGRNWTKIVIFDASLIE
jgi:hypothetical protein